MAVSVTPIRDTKWLTLEVCREFQRGTCSRPDTECKFAHPSKSCQVENGRVIACFDSLKVSNSSLFPRTYGYHSGGSHRNPGARKGDAAACRPFCCSDLCPCSLFCSALFLGGRGRDNGGNEGKMSLAGLEPSSTAAAPGPLAPNDSLRVDRIKGISRRNS